jgi:hypothetical protein
MATAAFMEKRSETPVLAGTGEAACVRHAVLQEVNRRYTADPRMDFMRFPMVEVRYRYHGLIMLCIMDCNDP